MTQFIRAAALSGFEDLVRSYQANPVTILKRAGIMPSQLRNAESLISYQSCRSAMELAAKKCNCKTFGLRLGAGQGLEMLGLVGAYMTRQPTIGQSLQVAQKYTYVHTDGIMIVLNTINEGLCTLSVKHINASYDHYPQKMQLSLAVINRLLLELIGNEWRAIKVTFRQSLEAKFHSEFEQFFNCPVEFSSEKNGLYFHPKYLRKQPLYDHSQIDQMLLEQFKTTKPVGADIVNLVKNTLQMLLSAGDCNKENVALCLNMHSKKLERELKESNVSFRKILEEVRKQEALRMLDERKMTKTTIALNLGYAEYSVFSRQFKQWFGVSPSQWETIKENS